MSRTIVSAAGQARQRTCGWLGRCRRLSRDYEAAPATGRNPIGLAMYTRLRRNAVLAAGAMALILLMAIGCGEESPQQYDTTESDDNVQVSMVRPVLSDAALAGEDLFNANCSLCHGVNAAGTHQGPPLIHKIYEPGHHSDFSIRNAVRRGVRQHHWQFGDMPPVAGISADDEEKIICYVREMQRANGIFEGDAFGTAC